MDIPRYAYAKLSLAQVDASATVAVVDWDSSNAKEALDWKEPTAAPTTLNRRWGERNATVSTYIMSIVMHAT